LRKGQCQRNGTTAAKLKGKYDWGANPVAYSSGGEVHFEHQDWLGTERARTSYSGSVEGTFTSLPFGDAQGTVPDGDANHFAMLDHDWETNTDHALFRQYSDTQGNWLSPDPYIGSYNGYDPQSFNRYAYVENNPLGYVDPSGLMRFLPVPDPDGGWLYYGYANGCETGACESGWFFDPGYGEEGCGVGVSCIGSSEGGVGSGTIWDDRFMVPYGGLEDSVKKILGIPTMDDIDCLPFCSAARSSGPTNVSDVVDRAGACAKAYYGIDTLSGIANIGKWGAIAAGAGGIPKSVPKALGLRVFIQPGGSEYTSALSILSLASGGGGVLRVAANFASKWAGPIAIASVIIDAGVITACTISY
jgi:RHS repeat-associated protein